MLNLLNESLLRVADGPNPAHVVILSLPQLYARLSADQDTGFPGLPESQEHYFHAFLVQLAYLALEAEPSGRLPADAPAWRAALRRLTPDYPDDAPWHLTQPDPIRPAFLQPPAPTPEQAADYRKELSTPDQLDLPLTAKAHEIKAGRALDPWPEHWIYALIALQTAAGYSGAGHYGIARMNGGFSSRPGLGLAPSHRWGQRFRRDLAVLREHGPRWYQQKSPGDPQGHKLLWLLPWGGQAAEQLDLSQIHPAAIEICRRIRLSSSADPITGRRRLAARAAGSKAARINAKDCNGVLGDPWIPVNRPANKPAKALTLAPGGFSQRRLLRYLTDPEWTPPLLAQPTAAEAAAGRTMLLTAQGLVRGQGKTEGWHEAAVPLGPALLPALADPPNPAARELLDTVSAEREAALTRMLRILSYSLQTIAGAGDPSALAPEAKRQASQAAVYSLLTAVEADWIAELHQELATPPEERLNLRRRWERNVLLAAARNSYRQRRPRSSAAAGPRPAIYGDLTFDNGLRSRNGFPYLFPNQPGADDNAAATTDPEAEPTTAAATAGIPTASKD